MQPQKGIPHLWRSACLLWGLIFSLGSQAQERQVTEQQSLVWLNYSLRLPSDQWMFRLDLEDRRYWFPGRQHQFLFPCLYANRRIASRADIGFGTLYFRQSLPHDPFNPVEVVPQEFRAHVEANFWSFSPSERLRWSHRIRSEARFLQEIEENEVVDSYAFVVRMRYRFRVEWSWFKDDPAAWKSIVSVEPMLQFGERIVFNTFDQNRTYVGVQHRFSRAFSAELGYMHWYQQRLEGFNYFSRHIVRFALYHSLHFKAE